MSPRDHSQFQDLLEQHISGEALLPQDRFALFDHIETCDDCRQMLEAEERITARMKTVPRLVAPLDLRSRILSQALRDHRERTTTPSEDPTVADLLSASPQRREGYLGNSSAPGTNTFVKSSMQVRSANDDLPVFAGISIPRPSRIRRVWRRSSPVMATGFLIIAGIGALYTGQFQGIPLADQAQQLVWAAVGSVRGQQDSFHPAIISPTPYPEVVDPSSVSVAGINTSVTPLPGTQTVTNVIREARVWLASADSTVAALARASEEAIPIPAEDAQPQIAALVLKPTDSVNNPGGFGESALAAALIAVAETQPGGRVTQQDQFAMGGHRYKLYTLEMPTGSMRRMAQTLNPYQAPSDSVVVSALASQNQVNMSRNQSIQFYSSNQAQLRSALQTIVPVSNGIGHERVRVVVVE